MMGPLPVRFWEAVRHLAEPDELMKFTLIYDGDLPSAGNKNQPIPASIIRNVFHDQLADLWESHVILRQLVRTARVSRGVMISSGVRAPRPLPDYNEPIVPARDNQID